ncbi:MAG: DUF1610 domain-containing protein [Planctomycetes bacterium]|nr:DUF1610 domain-containing protein [Planctomycetota bacterium]
MKTAPAGEPARFPCRQCGAQLVFTPGAEVLRCEYCGCENPIQVDRDAVAEHDYRATLAGLAGQAEMQERSQCKCAACGAEIEPPANATAFACPFCGADIVTAAQSRKLIKPHAVLPFKVDRPQALQSFQRWLKTLWFAPRALKQFARVDHRFSGMYVPHWTYDSRAISRYAGQRGDDYYVNETYTTTVNGRAETRTRQVRHTRWTNVSGVVQNLFDDVLVAASESLPPDILASLEPWDLAALVSYRDEFLSGFRAESYQIGLEAGFESASEKMEPEIRRTVCADIGGDHQRIVSLQVRYEDVRFKHILLPVWISAYRYRERTYRFLVNAQTGETRGQRPYSWIKITAFVLMILVAIAAVVMFLNR